jgi:hypothetical protein
MIEVLREALSRFDEVVSVLHFDEKLQSLAETRESARKPEWRRLIYSGAIINLYAALEQFVDDTISRYAKLCSVFFPDYSKVPEAIRKAHDSQARQLLTRDGGGRLSRDEVDEMVRCLASCLDGGSNYSLSGTALSFHDRNLKAEVVTELLQRINVSHAATTKKIDLEEVKDGVLSGLYSDIDGILADLVSRRNEISHGGYADLASSEILEAIAEVLKRFAVAVFDEIRKSTYQAIKADQVGYVKDYYSRPKAHIVSLAADEISVGDLIFGIEKNTSRLRAAKVISLRDDDIDAQFLARDALRASDGCIGLVISPEINLVGTIYSMNAEVSAHLMDAEYIDTSVAAVNDIPVALYRDSRRTGNPS